MGSVSIAWRLTDEPNASGDSSGRIGDIVAVVEAGHLWGPLERTVYGLAEITEIPDEKMEKIEQLFHRGIQRVRVVKDLGDGSALAAADDHEFWWTRRYSISKARCLAQWPTLSSAIDKLFDPEFTVPLFQIPQLPWSKFRAVFTDRLTGEGVDDLET